MLIVEDWDASATGFEDLHDFLEELVTRIKRLSFLIVGIVAVLADDHHAVHSEFACTEREGVRNRGKDGYVIALRTTTREVAVRELIDVERYEVHAWLLPFSAPSIAESVAVDEVL